jgi:uncharacterized protein YkwD
MVVNRRSVLRTVEVFSSIGAATAFTGCTGTVDDTKTTTPEELPSFDAAHGDVFSEIKPVEMAIHDATNKFREDRGRSPYDYQSRLAAISRNHSRNMAMKDFFAHTDHKGRGVGDRVDAYGYKGIVSENLIRFTVPDSWDAQQVGSHAVSGWKDSAGHRMTLLDETKVEAGVGAYLTDQEEIFITAMYGNKNEEFTDNGQHSP